MVVVAHAPAPAAVWRRPAAHGARGAAGVQLRVRHEREDDVQRDGADGGQAVDVAEVHLAGQEEEGAEEQAEDDGAEQVAVVHDVLVDARERVEDGEGLFTGGTLVEGRRYKHSIGSGCPVAHLDFDVLEVHAKLLQQRRLSVVPLRPECGQPACAQPALLAHPPADALPAVSASCRHEPLRSAIAGVRLCLVA